MTDRPRVEHAPPFAELDDACRAKGWSLEIHDAGGDGRLVAVMTPGSDANYTRHVQAGESYNRCAEIILNGLRRSKVLPPRA